MSNSKYQIIPRKYYGDTLIAGDISDFNNINEIKYSELEEGMIIYIKESERKNVKIRELNNYWKEQKKNIKILSNIEKCNTVVSNINDYVAMKRPNTYFVENEKGVYESGPFNAAPIRAEKNTKVVQVDCCYLRNFLGIKDKDTQESVDIHLKKLKNGVKFIKVTALHNITIERQKNSLEVKDYNYDTVLSLLKERNSCQLICIKLKNKSLDNLIGAIVAAYYTTKYADCRTYILNLLDNYYILSGNNKVSYAKLLSKVKSWYDTAARANAYMRSMKSFGVNPEKEIVLEIMNYYQFCKNNE